MRHPATDPSCNEVQPLGTDSRRWQRRARPQLGTLVEIGVPADTPPALLERGFAAVAAVQAALSRFDPASDIARFHCLPAGHSLALQPHSQRVLRAAAALHSASGGRFDLSLGTGPQAWRLASGRLARADTAVQLDAGGIAKGHAVDTAVRALRRAGVSAGWVNAGGDLRAFGALRLPLTLRDETGGGVRPLGWLEDGAWATSHFAPGSRSLLHGGSGRTVHVSVAAPRALWADALTKLVAVTGDAQHPLLVRLGARAWLH